MIANSSCTGARHPPRERPRGRLQLLVPLLRIASETPKPHAPGCDNAVLLPAALDRRPRSTRTAKDRLHDRPAGRVIIQDPLLSRHSSAVQSRAGQPAVAGPRRPRHCLAQHVQATHRQEMHGMRLGAASSRTETAEGLDEAEGAGQGLDAEPISSPTSDGSRREQGRG